MSAMASLINGNWAVYSTNGPAEPKVNVKLRITGPLWGEVTTSGWLIPLTKGR